jgi:hypothetical protein
LGALVAVYVAAFAIYVPWIDPSLDGPTYPVLRDIMAALSRFQMDLTPDELESIERWSAFAGFRTKRDFFLNAFALFQWAAKQILLGRSICAINEATGEVRHLEMPGLAVIAAKTTGSVLSPEELHRRTAEPGKPLAEFLAKLKETSGGEGMGRDLER